MSAGPRRRPGPPLPCSATSLSIAMDLNVTLARFSQCIVDAKEVLDADYQAVRKALRKLNQLDLERTDAIASMRAKLDELLTPGEKSMLRKFDDAKGRCCDQPRVQRHLAICDRSGGAESRLMAASRDADRFRETSPSGRAHGDRHAVVRFDDLYASECRTDGDGYDYNFPLTELMDLLATKAEQM